MAAKPDPSQLNAEFGAELEVERQHLLRRRFLWYTGTVASFTGIVFLGGLLFGSPDKAGPFLHILGLFFAGAGATLFAGSFIYVYLNQSTRWPLIKICLWLIVISGILNLLAGPLAMGQMETIIRNARARAAETRQQSGTASAKRTELKVPTITTPKENPPPVPDSSANPPSPNPQDITADSETPEPSLEEDLSQEFRDGASQQAMLAAFKAIGVGLVGAFSIFGRHFLACLFLPLTPRECIRPLIPLLLLNAALVAIYVTRVIVGGASGYIALAGLTVIAISPAIGIPGYLVVWWRDSKFREGVLNRMMRGRYVEMHRELVDARRIHESLFPAPIGDQAISLTYAYEPMRQIGGDYLFCKHTLGPAGNQRLNIVILDVTGHGIPAALTVNRLHGELERIYAEQPNSDPGHVLRLLNRYVNLTLASHWVYVTGLCVRVDSVANVLEFASGGHPPAFIYRANGEIEELHSTAMILGAVSDAEFDSAMISHRFMPADRLIAYTDGAFECRDRDGNQLRIAGIRSLISRGPGSISDWPMAIIKCVEQFRHGPPPDDTLVVELQYSAHAQLGPRSEPKTEFFKAARSGIYRAIKN